jgi:prepilin-type processing-associated H-X9-DG protein
VRVVLFLALFLAGCAKSGATAEAAQSACRVEIFEESRFTVCDPGKGNLELFAAGRDEPAIRRLADLEAGLGSKADTVAFAMNAGMYDEDGRPIGLAIVEGHQKHAINRRDGGGNFHMMPNGVFQVRKNGRAEVVASDKWRPSPDIRIATQSGPMLVIDGKLHPAFEPDGMSRNIRNGVGVTGGKALFVISDDPVSFGKFARFFRDRMKARNALFFDGSVSALWDPANGRRDLIKPLGPMVVAYRPR